MVNSDLASTMVPAMPVRSCGRRVVTCSPEGSATVSFATAWLVLPASAPILWRAIADACGSTNHEAWPTARPLRNAAGLTTAGPYVMREPGGPDPATALAPNPETGTRSSAQYGDAGFLGRNRPVTRSPAGAGRDCAWHFQH